MMDFSEEFADMLTNMAISYEKNFIAQDKKHVGGAFLNGYQTAVYHILSQIQQNPATLGRLQWYLSDMMKAFDLMTHRGGVQPSIKIEQ